MSESKEVAYIEATFMPRLSNKEFKFDIFTGPFSSGAYE